MGLFSKMPEGYVSPVKLTVDATCGILVPSKMPEGYVSPVKLTVDATCGILVPSPYWLGCFFEGLVEGLVEGEASLKA